MNTEFEVHAVKVSGYPVYKCRTCGRTGRGDWTSVDFGGALPTQNELERIVGVGSIPVGWASYGHGVVECPGPHDPSLVPKPVTVVITKGEAEQLLHRFVGAGREGIDQIVYGKLRDAGAPVVLEAGRLKLQGGTLDECTNFRSMTTTYTWTPS